MTGFASVEGKVGAKSYRLEIKSLNHRFLDLKVRLPRELSSHEMAVRGFIQSRFQRGSFELKLDRVGVEGSTPDAPTINLSLAAHYYESLVTLQKTLGLTDPIRTIELASFPDVFSKGETASDAPNPETIWPEFEKLLNLGADTLQAMREREGSALVAALEAALDELGNAGTEIRTRRGQWEVLQKEKFKTRITTVFEAYPVAQSQIQSVLESRIAQELALLLDRSDIEEELTRLEGHLAHFRMTLKEAGAVGRKLDFLAQELNREVNTLGNKAQDLTLNELAVPMKVKLEQIREQVMNLE